MKHTSYSGLSLVAMGAVVGVLSITTFSCHGQSAANGSAVSPTAVAPAQPVERPRTARATCQEITSPKGKRARFAFATGDDLTNPRIRWCSKTPECAKEHKCAGIWPHCFVGTKQSCSESTLCKRNGLCSVENNACVALTDKDCGPSFLCDNYGQCTARKGVCVAGSDAACERSLGCGADEKTFACTRKGAVCVPAKPKDCTDRHSFPDSVVTRHLVDGLCVTQTPKDCEKECKKYGRCSPESGGCRATSVADCRRSTECKRGGSCHLSGWGYCSSQREMVKDAWDSYPRKPHADSLVVAPLRGPKPAPRGSSCKEKTGCGPAGKDDCCHAGWVPPADRHSLPYGREDPHFVSTPQERSGPSYHLKTDGFYLDLYEVTVGRFRAFVQSGWRPSAGSGAHPKIPCSGWDPAWNEQLPKTAIEWDRGLGTCHDLSTWSPTPTAKDNVPINCVTWYEAAAFCAWDGGRLPTNAEWEIAATKPGGGYMYPWGPRKELECGELAPLEPTRALLSTPFRYGETKPAGVKGIGGWSAIFLPVGVFPDNAGPFGHLDLVGHRREWVLDFAQADYRLTDGIECHNCANLVRSRVHVRRGGRLRGVPVGSYYEDVAVSSSRSSSAGFRCAR